MITVTLRCQYCTSPNLVRNGLAADGRQRYLCRACSRRSREAPRSPAYTPAEREQILRTYEERSSLRGLARIFGVSRNTVTAWLKKSSRAAGPRGDAPRSRAARAGVG